MLTLKGRVILHHTADSVVVDAQLPPHKLTTETLNGLFVSEQDEKAVYFGAAQIHTFDNASFIAQVMEIYGFDDGSTIATKAEIPFVENGSNTYAGELTVMGGTGRFKGIKGRGRMNGWSNGYNARHDIEITYSTPS